MFVPHSYDGSMTPDSFEYHTPAKAAEIDVGMALAYEAGVLTIATGSTAPEYIAMQESPAGEETRIAVIRVQDGTVYETTLGEEIADIAEGKSYCLDETGGSIAKPAQESDAVFAKVVSFDGTAEGDKVRVRF